MNTPVAQLVEQAAHNRQVVGSSPTGSTFKKEENTMTEEQITVMIIVSSSCLASYLLGLFTGKALWKKKKRMW